jgi:hypothetical protein
MRVNKSHKKHESHLPHKDGKCLPGPGRPKGMPNKTSRIAKENIETVYAGLGGVKEHIAFLKRHPKCLADFYRDVYPKLLAINVQHGGEISHTLSFKFGENGENGK